MDALPTREQIAAETDSAVLDGWMDQIARAIAKIETDLEFRDDTDDWERRAINALAFHKYLAGRIERRLKALEGTAAAIEPRWIERNPLTQAALDGEIPDTLEGIVRTIEAVEADRIDEIARSQVGARDDAWLASVAVTLKRLKAARHELMIRQAEDRRAAKIEALRKREEVRERRFIEAARDVLPPEAYRAIWDRVDRQIAEQSDERIAA